MLEEVVVTAQKQQENLQAVPMSIQAFGTTKLEELRIQNMEQYVRFMPSVSIQSLGPGFTRVFMRGVASGDNGNHSGPMPSVGMYLDEQPVTTIQGPLDIHLYDIERVEMLAGPQGTLYGASSQAGTIRTITNKPDATAFSGSYDVQGSFVESGDQGYLVQGFVNIPLTDSAAIRLVGWYDHTPGYIDNVEGSMTFPTSGITMTNSNRVEKNYNDVDTYGGRAALKIDLNDSWSITPMVMGQVQKANGIFAYDPGVGDLEVSHFFPEKSDDTWVQAALTVEGKIGNFDLVYAGAYLDRNVDSRSDYSDYSYWYDVLSGYGSYIVDNDGQLINPAQYIKAQDGYKMWSNELRLSSPRDQRFRFVAGLFAQTAEHQIEQRYMINGFADAISVTGWPDTLWLTQQTRKDQSYAAFGEMYYDITDNLTGTLGLRLFNTKNSLKGFFGFNYPDFSGTGEPQCFNDKNYNGAPCVNLNKDTDESGNTPKVNLAYKFDEDRMVYATYSEGFRPGGVNRRGTFPPYEADYLTNYEAGLEDHVGGRKGAVQRSILHRGMGRFPVFVPRRERAHQHPQCRQRADRRRGGDRGLGRHRPAATVDGRHLARPEAHRGLLPGGRRGPVLGRELREGRHPPAGHADLQGQRDRALQLPTRRIRRRRAGLVHLPERRRGRVAALQPAVQRHSVELRRRRLLRRVEARRLFADPVHRQRLR